MPVKIFFCYSRRDEELLDELKLRLIPLQHQGLVDVWDDRAIIPGDDVKREISRHLNEADIILLLVSPEFMAFRAYGVEVERAMERHKRGETRVIPVILRLCDWEE